MLLHNHTKRNKKEGKRIFFAYRNAVVILNTKKMAFLLLIITTVWARNEIFCELLWLDLHLLFVQK